MRSTLNPPIVTLFSSLSLRMSAGLLFSTALGLTLSLWLSLPLPLAEYHLHANSQERAALTLHRSQRLTLRLVPARAIAGPVELRAYLRGPAGLQPWPVQPELLPDGSFFLSALVADLPVLATLEGEVELTFILGHGGPAGRAAALWASQPPERVLRLQLRVIA